MLNTFDMSRKSVHPDHGVLLSVVFAAGCLLASCAVTLWCHGWTSFVVPLLALLYFCGWLFLPGLRPDRRQWVSARNVVVVVFFVKLILNPVLLAVGGIRLGVLPGMPADSSVMMALLIDAGEYLAVGFGLECGRILFSRSGPRGAAVSRLPDGASMRTGIIMLLVGVASLSVTLAPVVASGNLLGVLAVPQSTGSATWVQLMARLGKGFLPYGVVQIAAAMQSLHARRRTYGWPFVPLGVVLLGGIGSSRVGFMIPCAAFLSTYTRRIHRISLVMTTIVLSALLGLVVFVGQVRTTISLPRDASSVGSNLVHFDWMGQLQVYLQAPQFGAFVIDAADRQGTVRTVIPSLLESLPVLGRPFRDSSGSWTYNMSIYGSTIARDQVLPVSAEIYWNYGMVGVFLGGVLIGIAFAWLQKMLQAAMVGSVLEYYAWCHLTLLATSLLILSLSVFGQFLIYDSWPAWLALVLTNRHRSRTDLMTDASG